MELVDRDNFILRQLSTEHMPLPELFDVAMAFALLESRQEERAALERCAQGGYAPAQAIYHAIMAGVQTETTVIGASTEFLDWVVNAVASGFLFAPISFRSAESTAYELAKERFRNMGGYNMRFSQHSMEAPNEETNGEVVANESKREPVDDLRQYPLHFLAGFAKLETSSMLSWTQDLNATDLEGDTPLLKCCKAGQIDNLRVLAKHKPDASITNTIFGTSPLHWLFVFPETHVCEAAALLAQMGADFQSQSFVSAVESFHFPFAWPSGAPLHWAAFANSEPAVRALVAHGADIYQEDAAHQTGLCIAIKLRNAKMVKLFITLGASLGTNASRPPERESEYFEDDYDRTALRTPIHTFLSSPLEVGTDVDLAGFEGTNVYIPPSYDVYIFMDNELHLRTQETIQILLQQWPECFTWLDSDGMTPVHCYVMYSVVDTTILDYIMKIGPDLDDLSPGQISILGLLFQHNAWRVGDAYLQSFIARFVGSVMSKGRRITFLNRKDPFLSNYNRGCHDHRPLHFAANLGLPKCTETLLALGADPTVRTTKGRTPADLASDALGMKRKKFSDGERVQMFDTASSGTLPCSTRARPSNPLFQEAETHHRSGTRCLRKDTRRSSWFTLRRTSGVSQHSSSMGNIEIECIMCSSTDMS